MRSAASVRRQLEKLPPIAERIVWAVAEARGVPAPDACFVRAAGRLLVQREVAGGLAFEAGLAPASAVRSGQRPEPVAERGASALAAAMFDGLCLNGRGLPRYVVREVDRVRDRLWRLAAAVSEDSQRMVNAHFAEARIPAVGDPDVTEALALALDANDAVLVELCGDLRVRLRRPDDGGVGELEVTGGVR